MNRSIRLLAAVATAAAMPAALAAPLTVTKSNGDLIVGSGIPGTNFTTADGNGVQVALKARDRNAGQALSQSGSTYFVSPGTVGGNPLFSFDFQLSPTASGLTPTDLWLRLRVDFDPGPGTDFATILAPVGDSDSSALNSWDDGDGFFTNPGGGAWSNNTTPFVVSNSWNLGYAFWATAFGKSYDPNRAGAYDIEISALRTAEGEALASTRITAVVGNVPEPATLALAGLAIAGMAVARRRRS